MCKVTVIYHSSSGHTKSQAEAIARGAATVKNVESELLTVQDASERIDDLDNSDAIVFGCPTYMGSISADMKKFLELAAQKWATLSWKDKIAGAFTSSSSFSGDKLNTLVGLMINAMQHGMIYVGFAELPSLKEVDAMNNVNGPGPEEINRVGSYLGPMMSNFHIKPPQSPPIGDILTSEKYGQRIAALTKKFKARS